MPKKKVFWLIKMTMTFPTYDIKMYYILESLLSEIISHTVKFLSFFFFMFSSHTNLNMLNVCASFHTDLPKLQSVLNIVLLDIISLQIHCSELSYKSTAASDKTEVTRSCHKFCDNWLLTFFETNVSLSHLMYLTSMQTSKTAFFPAVIHRPGLLTCLQASLSQHMKLERERERASHTAD